MTTSPSPSLPRQILARRFRRSVSASMAVAARGDDTRASAHRASSRLRPRRHRAHLRQREGRRRRGEDERRRARGRVRHDEALERGPGLRLRAPRVRLEPRAPRPRLRRPLPLSTGRSRRSGPTRGARWRRSSPTKRARAIGVGNYARAAPRRGSSRRRTCRRRVNQIEVHPFLQHRDTRQAYCAKHGIVVEAYSPLTHAKRIDDPVITGVAQWAKRSNAQVLLRWGIQGGMVVLPKSINAARIAENAKIFDFELDADAMKKLDSLEEGTATGWDPRDQR